MVSRAMWLTAIVVPAAIGLYALPSVPLWLGALYVALLFRFLMARYALMLHAGIHRPTHRRGYRWMNQYVPHGLGLLFGQTPYTYFTHHLVMHHREDNGAGDTSSTWGYRRDHFGDWLKYAGRFLLFGTVDLARYLREHRPKLLRRFLGAEVMYWTVIAGLLWLDPTATLFVFVIPVLLLRLGAMAGNWAQHAFVDPSDPDDPYLCSTTLVDCPHNQHCYNDGYHVVHHQQPGLHWTQMPDAFQDDLASYARADAVVLSGVRDYQQLWMWLMLRRYDKLAEHFVDLRDADRSHEEIIDLLKARTLPIEEEPAAVSWSATG